MFDIHVILPVSFNYSFHPLLRLEAIRHVFTKSRPVFMCIESFPTDLLMIRNYFANYTILFLGYFVFIEVYNELAQRESHCVCVCELDCDSLFLFIAHYASKP